MHAKSNISGPGDGETGLPDRLSYMADLILELKLMAEQAGLGTLERALGLAHAEARFQLERYGIRGS